MEGLMLSTACLRREVVVLDVVMCAAVKGNTPQRQRLGENSGPRSGVREEGVGQG